MKCVNCVSSRKLLDKYFVKYDCDFTYKKKLKIGILQARMNDRRRMNETSLNYFCFDILILM